MGIYVVTEGCGVIYARCRGNNTPRSNYWGMHIILAASGLVHRDDERLVC